MRIFGFSAPIRWTAVGVVVCVVLALPGALAAEETTDIYRLGRAATRISPHHAVEFEDFQKQFAQYRAEYEKVLAEAAWSGDVDGLFAAVAAAEEGAEGPVVFRNVEPGQVMPWMALRRQGEATIVKNARWAAKVPFPAWEIRFMEEEQLTVFLVPQWCMNLALDRVEKIEKKVEPKPAPPPPPPPSPECSLQAMVSEDGVITFDSSASKGEVAITALTLPDGMAGDLDALESTGMGKWSYDGADDVGRKPGDYSFTATAVARLSGEEESCEAMATISKTGPAYRWIARGLGGGVNPQADNARWDDASTGERYMASVHGGTVFGLGLEYMVTENLGIDARVLYGSFDAHWMYDTDEVWLMGEDDIEYLPITVGLNYHFTPFSVVDFYAGPYIGYADLDDMEFELTEDQPLVELDFDSDFTYGLLVGVDIPFGDSPWLFTAAASYSFADAEANLGDGTEVEFDLDPITLVGGIGFRF